MDGPDLKEALIKITKKVGELSFSSEDKDLKVNL